MKKMIQVLQKNIQFITTAVFLITTLLLPVLILPLSENFVLNAKFYLLFVLAFATFLLWSAHTLVKKSVQLTLSQFTVGSFLLGGAALVSMVLNNTYVVSSLLGYGGLYIALSIIVIFGSSIIQMKSITKFLFAMMIPALFLSLATIAEMLGWGPSRVINIVMGTNFPSSAIFSLAGSPTVAAEFIFVVLTGVIISLFSQKKKKNVFEVIAAVIMLVGLALNGYTAYKSQVSTPGMLPLSTGWPIAVEGLKTARTALIGYGPDAYGNVFLHFKPVALNTTKIWSTQFFQGSNLPFTLISTLGLVGLAAWAFIVLQAGIRMKKQSKSTLPLAGAFFAAVLVELLLPPNPVILGIHALITLFWIVAEKDSYKDIQFHSFTVKMVKSSEVVQRVPEHSNAIVYVISAINLLGLVVVGYLLGRGMIGDFYRYRAEIAAIKNKPVDMYNLEQTAILFNPYMPSYRRSYSQTNMALALAISNANNSPDKDKVVNLIQQAIQEARVATMLDNSDATNWVVLARTYSQLIGVADQAPQFTVDAYTQAIANAPADPILRLELGGAFLRTQNYDQAIQVFQQLVSLKPDWPNGYYNLALSYRLKGSYDQAIPAYQQALALLDQSNDNYGKVKEEIAVVEKEAAAKKAKPTQTQVQPANTQTTQQSSLVAPNVNASPSAQTRRAKSVLDLSPSPTP